MEPSEVRTGTPAVVDLAAPGPVRCPCGRARRAFADVPDAPASVHRVEIEADARAHDHRDHAEIDVCVRQTPSCGPCYDRGMVERG